MMGNFLRAWGIYTFVGVMGLAALLSFLGYIFVTAQR